MKKILLIENDETSFNSIKKWLEDRKYSVVPENYSIIERAFDSNIRDVSITDIVIRLIKEHYKELRLVLCDIHFPEDDRGGNKVVQAIRNEEGLSSSYLSLLPIFAITDYASRQEAIICDGADYSILKKNLSEDPNVISAIIESRIMKFERCIKLFKIITDNKKVFIVHSNTSIVDKVARFIDHLGLISIILHEQPDDGDTIIEKIEKHSDVGYAIILYTSCDSGMRKNDVPQLQELTLCARQNVVFEHGFMTALLGRRNVCVLLEKGVEPPNDIEGLSYVPFDDKDAWKIKLVRNLRSRGFVMNMDQIF